MFLSYKSDLTVAFVFYHIMWFGAFRNLGYKSNWNIDRHCPIYIYKFCRFRSDNLFDLDAWLKTVNCEPFDLLDIPTLCTFWPLGSGLTYFLASANMLLSV